MGNGANPFTGTSGGGDAEPESCRSSSSRLRRGARRGTLALPFLLAAGLPCCAIRLSSTNRLKVSTASRASSCKLGLMALARIRKSPEQLRYVAPGEWGKLLGLDRIPEVRTLRAKLKLLCLELGRADALERGLGPGMDCPPERHRSYYFYRLRCHVRVYHGDQTALPRPLLWPASGCACGPPPIIGSTPWTANRSCM